MEFLADIAGGSGIFGSIVGAIGGIASAFVKYKTLKEQNRHTFVMAQLAGEQEVARAQAERELARLEGDIKIDLAGEESLQESFRHDASMGQWLRGADLGPITRGILATAEFVRMMMRPVLTAVAFGYVIRMYGAHLGEIERVGQDVVAAQLALVGSTIVMLATVSFTWWFADRSVSKTLQKKIGGQ